MYRSFHNLIFALSLPFNSPPFLLPLPSSPPFHLSPHLNIPFLLLAFLLLNPLHTYYSFSASKIISRLGAGVDKIDVEGWRSVGVVVTNTPEAVGDSTADLALALALTASRRLVEAVEVARSGDWR